jgi:hypothetical protein
MSQVGFEPTIPVFERAKTVHALDRAATVIGYYSYSQAYVSHQASFCSGWRFLAEVIDSVTASHNYS